MSEILSIYVSHLGWGWLLAGSIMTLMWLHQIRTGNATSVDVAWTAVLGILAALYAMSATGLPGRRLLIAVMAGAWSVRLSVHLLFTRVWGHEGEDGRYAKIRESWGDRSHRNFFWFYQAQGLLDVILSVPFLLVAMNPAPTLRPLEYAGAALLVAALIGESIADAQLARHRADASKKARTCRTGLWSVSRHPNYFFEWLNWCAFGLVALAAPYGWIALSAPLIMLYLVLNVTGIPPTEAQAVVSRGDDYRAYQREVSPFFPWFPRKRAGRPLDLEGTT